MMIPETLEGKKRTGIVCPGVLTLALVAGLWTACSGSSGPGFDSSDHDSGILDQQIGPGDGGGTDQPAGEDVETFPQDDSEDDVFPDLAGDNKSLDQDGATPDIGDAAETEAETIAVDPCLTDNGGCGDPAVVECLAVPGLDPACLVRCDVDYPALTNGVKSIDQGGALPSMLVAHGANACPLLVDELGHTLVAYAFFGQGRVVHAGHEALIVGPAGDAQTLVLNAVRWLGKGATPAVGIEAGTGGPAALLTAHGMAVQTVTLEDLDTIDVLITNSYVKRSDEEVQTLKAWVDGGGGLLQGGHAWWWSYSNEDVFGEYPGNRILNDMGITVTASADVSAGVETIPQAPLSGLLQARRALVAVARHVAGVQPLGLSDQGVASHTLISAVSQIPVSFAPFFGPVQEVLSGIPAVCPTRKTPLVPAKKPIDALVVTLLTRLASEKPASEVVAIPCDFPGPMDPGAQPETETVQLDASYAGMDSDYGFAGAGTPLLLGTGLYAAPGQLVTVSVPDAWAGKGLGIRISPFTDTLWEVKEWQRFPDVSRRYEVDAATFEVASAFGGPLYLEVPSGAALGNGGVTFEGAFAMARFVLGETEDFATQFEKAPAPVVELESDRLVLTVLKAELTPDVEPDALMDFWNQVLDADATLAGIPLDRVRPERIAVDRQISAGWMHSGYPIMSYDWAGPLTDVEYLTTTAEWGAFHELGHNHQYAPAVLPGTIEATCNLWSVYVSENVVGVDRSIAHPALTPSSRHETIAAYVAGGKDFWNDWNVWTALETYLQLQEAFGWEPLIDVHSQYLAMSAQEKPTTDIDRIDQWVALTSVATGHNLVPFYQAWGFPISPWVPAETSALPTWDDHPMTMW
jgi:hypothetical protein